MIFRSKNKWSESQFAKSQDCGILGLSWCTEARDTLDVMMKLILSKIYVLKAGNFGKIRRRYVRDEFKELLMFS